MQYLSKLYQFTPLRIVFKLSMCLIGVKIVGDFFYATIGTTTIAFPRHTHQFEGVQHPLDPPIKLPYIHGKTAQQVRDLQAVNKHYDKIGDVIMNQPLLKARMYKNCPQRQDPNQIDHFMRYAEANRIMDMMYARVLKQMKDSGIVIPEGINLRIRQLSQFQFRNTEKIIPQL